MKKIIASAVFGIVALAAQAADIPQFPGGDEALQSYIVENMQYPPLAKRHGIEGNVIVSFMVEPDGTISSIKIVRMIDPDLEAEAIRIVKSMPSWQPATEGGKSIAAPATITVQFRL